LAYRAERTSSISSTYWRLFDADEADCQETAKSPAHRIQSIGSQRSSRPSCQSPDLTDNHARADRQAANRSGGTESGIPTSLTAPPGNASYLTTLEFVPVDGMFGDQEACLEFHSYWHGSRL
jgi:hypothetical protein